MGSFVGAFLGESLDDYYNSRGAAEGPGCCGDAKMVGRCHRSDLTVAQCPKKSGLGGANECK